MSVQDLERAARELLAVEYERLGWESDAHNMRNQIEDTSFDHAAIYAIVAALRLQSTLEIDDEMVERACRNRYPDWDEYGDGGRKVRADEMRTDLVAAIQRRPPQGLTASHPVVSEVKINFPQIGTAGPFPVVDGEVTLPQVTMDDLIAGTRRGSSPTNEVVIDGRSFSIETIRIALLGLAAEFARERGL